MDWIEQVKEIFVLFAALAIIGINKDYRKTLNHLYESDTEDENILCHFIVS